MRAGGGFRSANSEEVLVQADVPRTKLEEDGGLSAVEVLDQAKVLFRRHGVVD